MPFYPYNLTKWPRRFLLNGTKVLLLLPVYSLAPTPAHPHVRILAHEHTSMLAFLALLGPAAQQVPEFDSPCAFLHHGVQSQRFADPALVVPTMQQAVQHVAAALRSIPHGVLVNSTAGDAWALAQQSAAYVLQQGPPCAINSSVPPLPVPVRVHEMQRAAPSEVPVL